MSPRSEKTAIPGLTTNRLEGFSDGVIAIIVTLLVLNFDSVTKDIGHAQSSGEVWTILAGILPDLLGYALSFVLIAIYWIMHDIMFHYIERADRGLLWINLLFLMCAAFVPLPTDWLTVSLHHEFNAILLSFAGIHMLTSFSLIAMWIHATRNRRLVSEHIDPKIIRTVMKYLLLGPIVYSIGIVVSLFSTTAGVVVLMVTPVFYVWPSHVDAHWLALRKKKESAEHHSVEEVHDSLTAPRTLQQISATIASSELADLEVVEPVEIEPKEHQFV